MPVDPAWLSPRDACGWSLSASPVAGPDGRFARAYAAAGGRLRDGLARQLVEAAGREPRSLLDGVMSGIPQRLATARVVGELARHA